ncbi:M20/M25/M40 family metallo-hydrolase [Liquorilactobacillus satsumensis]|uniref:Acetylornithine deacetylase succinyl-diaminopimelate desuccinylase-like protein n=1 Tax=Liquorilactobacillus satsumensis DSM 16230 = JCM 12392 TaxID=1423801 RepID=A0A0R1V0D5_9LACO|nr:M20/M25/M40 family metallo-hydrolase [Liquorilactobacillus satsumensis]KRL99071.1 acetylornithine deacetylase succinyl-diaminopimelate desuccinylase-like protein [Liquorilactobacillus satsumensis DSM 16230 = JCM 12392]MCP9329195.1 M20/M25/M40 family metallo-hydrolase [Liquorilactobacillus satsumensis]
MKDDEKKIIEAFVEEELPSLFDYLKIPSISAQNKGIDKTVAWIVDKFKILGAAKVEKWNENDGNPVIFAEFNGKSEQTVLFYNHYDVQPPDPLDEWLTEPFEPTIKDGKIFARGICDDKGELLSRLSLIDYFNQNGGLPVNIKFLIEGEEEIGSPRVEKYVCSHAEQLSADYCIWEGGGKDEHDNFQITCGLKGIVSFEMKVATAKKDLHSSLATFADNAAWRLVEALNSLRDKDGQVLVDGFYDDIVLLDENTKQAISELDFDKDKLEKNYGLLRPISDRGSADSLVNGNTITINGLTSGYEGDGSKTIIPSRASAKLDCRLVPDQDPQKIAQLIQKQLVVNGFSDVKVDLGHGEYAFRTPLNDSFVKLCKKIGDEVYGVDNCLILPNMPGSGPAQQFNSELKVPIVMVGIHYAGSGPHSPNENIRLEDYKEGSFYLYKVLQALGNK